MDPGLYLQRDGCKALQEVAVGSLRGYSGLSKLEVAESTPAPLSVALGVEKTRSGDSI